MNDRLTNCRDVQREKVLIDSGKQWLSLVGSQVCCGLLGVLFCFFFKKKYVEYSLFEITVWEQTQNIQDPQTALRNAGIFHGYLSSEEKGEEESEFKNLQFTFQTALSSSSSHLEHVKHFDVAFKNIYRVPSICLHAGPWILHVELTLLTMWSRAV